MPAPRRTLDHPPIDFAAIAKGTDLRRLVESCLGPPERIVGGKPHWRCPFHADGTPSFYTWDDNRRWWCWPCAAGGDVLDFLCRLERIGPVEAARRLAPHLAGSMVVARGGPKGGRAAARPAPSKPPAWECPRWQESLDGLVCLGEQNLWGPLGRPALAYLRSRGLRDETIGRFRLGYLPRDVATDPLEVLDDGRGPRPIYLPRGITIPWVRPGSWYTTAPDPDEADPGPRWVGLNVRRLATDPFAPLPAKVAKYRAASGSERGNLYPWPDVQLGWPCLIAEGEIDALITWQDVGHVLNVGTCGGTSNPPTDEARSALAGCPRWLLAFDRDAAGAEAVGRWVSYAPRKVARARLPEGMDLNDFAVNGGQILNWLAGEYSRLGWRWPLRSSLCPQDGPSELPA